MESSREEILTRIRAVEDRYADHRFTPETEVQAGYSERIYKDVDSVLAECFERELEAVSGQCERFDALDEAARWLANYVAEHGYGSVYCRDAELIRMLTAGADALHMTGDEAELLDMQVGVTTCECLVARTGSVLMSSALSSGRQMHAYAPVHVVVAYEEQLFPYVEDAMRFVHDKYDGAMPSSLTTVTGPSRTADIEKTLVLGAHGPKELIVLLIR